MKPGAKSGVCAECGGSMKAKPKKKRDRATAAPEKVETYGAGARLAAALRGR